MIASFVITIMGSVNFGVAILGLMSSVIAIVSSVSFAIMSSLSSVTVITIVSTVHSMMDISQRVGRVPWLQSQW